MRCPHISRPQAHFSKIDHHTYFLFLTNIHLVPSTPYRNFPYPFKHTVYNENAFSNISPPCNVHMCLRLPKSARFLNPEPRFPFNRRCNRTFIDFR